MRLLERLPRETGRDYALRTLTENIINLDLAPGCFVSESELAGKMGLSRTPVREAIIELSKVKIIEVTPQKFSRIARIDYELVEESRFLRVVTECAAVELACSQARPEDIQQLEEILRLQQFYYSHGMLTRLMSADNQFHNLIFSIAHKSQVYDLIQNFSIHFDRVRRMSLESVNDLKIVEDHAAILNAIRSKDSDQALALMKRHLSRYKVDADSIRKKYPQYF